MFLSIIGLLSSDGEYGGSERSTVTGRAGATAAPQGHEEEGAAAHRQQLDPTALGHHQHGHEQGERGAPYAQVPHLQHTNGTRILMESAW